MRIPKFIEKHGFWIIIAIVGYVVFEHNKKKK